MNRFYQKSTNDFYTFILLTILSITTLALDHKYKQIDQIRSFISDLIVYPITMISSLPKSMIDDAIRESTNLDALEQEISRLKKENLSLKIKLQELASLRGENIRLRKITRESKVTSNKQTIVKVINSSASPVKRVVVIDKGKNDGIFIGQNVIGTKGLVGQIIETNSLTSKVILITEPSHDTPGEINRTGEKIIVSGSPQDKKLVVNFVSTNSDIQAGDVISTSGAGNRFKPKIPIGKVKNVSNDLDTEFKIVEIEPFEDPKKMPELILIWDYKPKENINE